MTTPYERTRALLESRAFLRELMSPADLPHVPAEVRERARRLLRHYPDAMDLQLAHLALPMLFAEVPLPRSPG